MPGMLSFLTHSKIATPSTSCRDVLRGRRSPRSKATARPAPESTRPICSRLVSDRYCDGERMRTTSDADEANHCGWGPARRSCTVSSTPAILRRRRVALRYYDARAGARRDRSRAAGGTGTRERLHIGLCIRPPRRPRREAVATHRPRTATFSSGRPIARLPIGGRQCVLDEVETELSVDRAYGALLISCGPMEE